MYRVVVLFCALLALTKAETTAVNRCLGSSAGPLPLNAYIQGCSTQPCHLPQGQDAVVEIVFQAPYVIRQMKTAAFAYLGLIPINYDLGPMAVTCNYLENTYCPLVQNEVVKYTLRMPIEDFMVVGTQLPIEFRILDDADSAIMCIRVVVRITPAGSKSGAQTVMITAEG